MSIEQEFKNYFPMGYLSEDSLDDFLGEFMATCINEIASKKKELKGKYNQWRQFIKEKRYSDIKLENKEEKTVFLDTLQMHLEGDIPFHIDTIIPNEFNLLSISKFPFLYLLDGYIPLIIESANFYELFSLENVDEFIDSCFENGIFDVTYTRDEISELFLNEYELHLDNFLACLEIYLNINIVCITGNPQLFRQKEANVLVSKKTKLLANRPTHLIYYNGNGEWFRVEYLNLNDNKLYFYQDLKNPHILRLKNLLDIQYKKENLDAVYIQYEPSDIGRELPVIELEISGKPYQFLVGCTYNLYLSKRDVNRLVGKLDISVKPDKESGIGRANVFWAEGYPGGFLE